MYEEILKRLSNSKFRSSFKLKTKDILYIRNKSLRTIQKHAEEFISKRIAPADIKNDGKQTPMKNHPVFIAQHATACCCRDCILKWHGFAKGKLLTPEQQKYIVGLIMEWIKRQL